MYPQSSLTLRTGQAYLLLKETYGEQESPIATGSKSNSMSGSQYMFKLKEYVVSLEAPDAFGHGAPFE